MFAGQCHDLRARLVEPHRFEETVDPGLPWPPIEHLQVVRHAVIGEAIRAVPDQFVRVFDRLFEITRHHVLAHLEPDERLERRIENPATIDHGSGVATLRDHHVGQGRVDLHVETREGSSALDALDARAPRLLGEVRSTQRQVYPPQVIP